jgi:hypothetical protein
MTITEDLAHRAEALEREAAAVRKLIEAAEQLGDERVVALLTRTNGNGNGHTNGNGHAEVPEPLTLDEIPEDAPRGREAIRLIVREKPGVWTLANLRAELKRRGWFTSNKGVDVAVTRLTRSGEAQRVGKGRYAFPAPEVGDAP